jgi:hypothetical protein
LCSFSSFLMFSGAFLVVIIAISSWLTGKS